MEKKQISMGEKGKRMAFTLGVAVLVYFSFRYLLEPALPFLLAWIAAGILRPTAKKLSKKIPFMKESISAGILMAFFTGGIFLCILFLGRELWKQAGNIAKYLPAYMEQFNAWFSRCCYQLENQLSLERGTILNAAYEFYDHAAEQMMDGSVTYFMGNSMSVFAWFGAFFAGAVVTVIAVVLTVKDWDTLKEGFQSSFLWEELSLVVRKLKYVGRVYLKSQLMIMFLTAVICGVGLWLMKNPYAALLGVVIGLLDALPLFGTGTVFLPWILVCLLQGSYIQGAELAAIYLICYFLREFLEARFMGNGIGITSLESLISIYAGFYLFGILGFLLGPIGYLIIKELTGQWLTNRPLSGKMEQDKRL